MGAGAAGTATSRSRGESATRGSGSSPRWSRWPGEPFLVRSYPRSAPRGAERPRHRPAPLQAEGRRSPQHLTLIAHREPRAGAEEEHLKQGRCGACGRRPPGADARRARATPPDTGGTTSRRGASWRWTGSGSAPPGRERSAPRPEHRHARGIPPENPMRSRDLHEECAAGPTRPGEGLRPDPRRARDGSGDGRERGPGPLASNAIHD